MSGSCTNGKVWVNREFPCPGNEVDCLECKGTGKQFVTEEYIGKKMNALMQQGLAIEKELDYWNSFEQIAPNRSPAWVMGYKSIKYANPFTLCSDKSMDFANGYVTRHIQSKTIDESIPPFIHGRLSFALGFPIDGDEGLDWIDGWNFQKGLQ